MEQLNFCLVIGAMKAGTTTIFEYLKQHPQINSSNRKETHFFTKNFKKGFNWYLSNWDISNNKSNILMESCGSYTKYPVFNNAAINIACVKQHDFKFIYIIRDPIKRIESHFNHAVLRGWLMDDLDGNLRHESLLIEPTKYAKQIGLYFNVFPSEKIKIIVFEELINNPDMILNDVCEFLGIDQNFKFSKLAAQNTYIDREISVLRKTNWVKYLPSFMINIYFKIRRKKIEISKKALNEKQKIVALDLLKEDIEKLKKDYKVNTSYWDL